MTNITELFTNYPVMKYMLLETNVQKVGYELMSLLETIPRPLWDDKTSKIGQDTVRYFYGNALLKAGSAKQRRPVWSSFTRLLTTLDAAGQILCVPETASGGVAISGVCLFLRLRQILSLLLFPLEGVTDWESADALAPTTKAELARIARRYPALVNLK